ncbi:MAG: hypothetical protein WCV84_01255 [Patescibacteria group bacterium]
MRFYLRAFFITVLRFFALIILGVFAFNFDVSPLPLWTLTAFVYLMDFFVTFLFALWTFSGHEVTWKIVGMVTAIFLIWGTLLELGLQFLLHPTVSWEEFVQNFPLQSLFVFLVFAFGVIAAGHYAIKKHARTMARSIGEGIVT